MTFLIYCLFMAILFLGAYINILRIELRAAKWEANHWKTAWKDVCKTYDGHLQGELKWLGKRRADLNAKE